MVFPTAIAEFIDFEEGLYEVGLDRARLVGLEAARAGQQAQLLSPKSAFGGRRGYCS